MDERDFVDHLKRQFPARAPVVTGIGDDGAVLTDAEVHEHDIVADMLLDDVHFSLATTSAVLVGRKAIAVNLSDLAAMGCRPTAAFVSIAIPKSLTSTGNFAIDLYHGIHTLAEEFNFTVAGGDTNVWTGPFAINVCMTGEPFGERAVLRSGARSGDYLLVTGALGGSLRSGRHLSFTPRLNVSQLLATNIDVHAMIDISDGLTIDLHRMMDASSTGSLLNATGIPIHDDVSTEPPAPEPLKAAMSDGEDFELLIALPPESVNAARHLVESSGESPLTVIGTVTEERGCRLINAAGDVSDLPVSGWQHG